MRQSEKHIRVLCLATDGFGGQGGIAQHCRHLLTALCESDQIDAVHGIPRVKPLDTSFENSDSPQSLPHKLDYHHRQLSQPLGYVRALIRVGLLSGSWDVIFTEHINLLPMAAVLSTLNNAKLVLIIHGYEAWSKPKKLSHYFLGRVNHVVSVSSTTRQRFLRWSRFNPNHTSVIPNAIDIESYSPGPRPDYLKERYGIQDQPVIMTLGRLSKGERAKGFDEIIKLLPGIHRTHPDLHYLIVGSGDDQTRLVHLSNQCGVQDSVIFAGEINESEKVDHYRFADAYIMPSRLEGFGYVFIEAMACGLPLVGSVLDGSRDALLGGQLGELIDPDNPEQLETAINKSLKKPKQVPDNINQFSLSIFNRSFQKIALEQ